MKKELEAAQEQLVKAIKEKQTDSGAWHLCLECPPMTDAYMIILMKSLEIDDEALIKKLVKRLETKQGENGAWKVFHDEDAGNLSATVEAYTALLFSGYKQKNDPDMEKARRFIQVHGGLDHVHAPTKVVLSLLGQYSWKKLLPVPIEIILLPSNFLVNFYDFSGYARVHFAPILILSDKKFVLKTAKSPNLSDLHSKSDRRHDEVREKETHTFLSFMKESINRLKGLPEELHKKAIEKTEQFMLDRIEPNGMLYSYFSATFLMIFALIGLGYSKEHPVIKKAINGIKGLLCETEKTIHLQNFTPIVWDTALLSYTLQTANVPPSDPSIQRALYFLQDHQQERYGDWAIHNSTTLPGGWGFSSTNTMNPDVDDTTAALRAFSYSVSHNSAYKPTWHRGVKWVLSMQNDDGGWPSFEKNTHKKLLTLVPFDDAEAVNIDPSTADLTGRTLEFLGKQTRMPANHPQIKSGIEWLRHNQQRDGSWYGKWGVCYIYGTWAALTGMRAVGVPADNGTILEGVRFLKSIQNSDGGWGESCISDVHKMYVPLGASTPTQTAWALDALIAVSDEPTLEINKGMKRLLSQLNNKEDWTYSYPTGGGLPGFFYTYYHSYNYIWPLLAISQYLVKYTSG